MLQKRGLFSCSKCLLPLALPLCLLSVQPPARAQLLNYSSSSHERPGVGKSQARPPKQDLFHAEPGVAKRWDRHLHWE